LKATDAETGAAGRTNPDLPDVIRVHAVIFGRAGALNPIRRLAVRHRLSLMMGATISSKLLAGHEFRGRLVGLCHSTSRVF